MGFLHAYTGIKRLSLSILSLTTWDPSDYMNFLHVYTGMKRLWWLVFCFDYMRSMWLHGFLKHALAKVSVGLPIALSTWVRIDNMGFLHVYTGIKRLSQPFFSKTTWLQDYMNFLHVYTGIKRLSWFISDYTIWDPLHFSLCFFLKGVSLGFRNAYRRYAPVGCP